jgi:ATP-dependent DNA ligase
MAVSDLPIRAIPTITVHSPEEAMEAHNALMLAKPDAEGSVLHSHSKVFSPGKRCWGTQRIKDVPTIDLMIVGYEEAVSGHTGLGNGMVGRIWAEFSSFKMLDNVSTIGIGPGALTHAERRDEWQKYAAGMFKPRIAEIRYMRDDTYDALRQPTFARWRDDKKINH